ncbi:unnamed protein product [Amoebophrya sp. A25]|nr:unnamed protein product [Amoebophrya sp. A25]|eukprot:GSA25T00015608001.1
MQFAGAVPAMKKAGIKADGFDSQFSGCRAVEVRIENETFVRKWREPASQSIAAVFDKIRQSVKSDPGPRFFLIAHPDGANVCLIWMPEETPTKMKFVYTQSVSQLKTLPVHKVDGSLWKDFRTDEVAELTEAALASQLVGVEGAQRRSLMSVYERNEEDIKSGIEATKKEISGGIRLPGMAPVEATVSSALETALKGLQNGGIVVARVEDAGGKTSVCGKVEKSGTLPTTVALAPADCCFMVWRRAADLVQIISYSSDNAASRAKMKHSSCAGTLREKVKATFADSVVVWGEAHDAEEVKEIEVQPEADARAVAQRTSAAPDDEATKSAVKQSIMLGGGKKVPVGSFRLPGME